MAIKIGMIIFLVSAVFGLYFLNLGFNFIPQIPQALAAVDKWINIVGGILLIVGGFFAMRSTPVYPRRF
jgi:hypothetical protein